MAEIVPFQPRQRHPDWEARLGWAIAVWHGRDYAPESGSDCAAFADACVTAVLGESWWPAKRPTYRSAAQQARAMKRAGWADLPAMADALLGPRAAPLMARRGDIVTDGAGLGVAFAGAAFAFGHMGLVRMHPDSIVACWPVGA
ncbi:MAG: hypothetical protein MUE77_10270 [Sandarakinorhabdus sp.]|jgi:hypothetical protein|nr:hypothetical protein [Sandarakinorhabdus sp.]